MIQQLTAFDVTKLVLTVFDGGVRKVWNKTTGVLVAESDMTDEDVANQVLTATAGDLPQLHVCDLSSLNPKPPAGNYDVLGWDSSQTVRKWTNVSTSRYYWDGEKEVDMASIDENLAAVKAQTDKLDFTGSDGMLKSESTNMRGTDDALLAEDYVAPDNDGISNIEIDLGVLSSDVSTGFSNVVDAIGNLNDFDPATDSVRLDLTQAVPTVNDVNTVGDALNAARAQGFGRWKIDSDANTLTLYGPNGTTPIQVFDLIPNASSPTERSPA